MERVVRGHSLSREEGGEWREECVVGARGRAHARRFRRACLRRVEKATEGAENHFISFFRKISPTGLAIPSSRLRVSPAPEMAHLLRPPFREAVPLLGNRTAQCCVRIAPPSWRGATPTLNM